MRSIREIRRVNLRILVDEVGSQVGFAGKVDKDKNQIYQWLLDPSQPAARGMRHETARDLEKKCGRPEGWMDHEHDAAPVRASPQRDHLDSDTLHTAIQNVEQVLQDLHVSATPEARAEITMAMYDLLREGQNMQAAARIVSRMLRAMEGVRTTPIK